LERRGELDQASAHQQLLSRIPTSKVTYMLCSPCHKKPLDERLLQSHDRVSITG